VNEHEAATLLQVPNLTHLASPLHAARELARSFQHVVITLGASGAVWASGQALGQQASHSVRAVDTTGAGDAFCGALCAALDDGLPLEHAVAWGNAAGALTATKPGTVAALPSFDALRALLGNTSFI